MAPEHFQPPPAATAPERILAPRGCTQPSGARTRGSRHPPPIGLILCTEKNEAAVQYALSKSARQIFTSRYQLHPAHRLERSPPPNPTLTPGRP